MKGKSIIYALNDVDPDLIRSAEPGKRKKRTITAAAVNALALAVVAVLILIAAPAKAPASNAPVRAALNSLPDDNSQNGTQEATSSVAVQTLPSSSNDPSVSLIPDETGKTQAPDSSLPDNNNQNAAQESESPVDIQTPQSSSIGPSVPLNPVETTKAQAPDSSLPDNDSQNAAIENKSNENNSLDSASSVVVQTPPSSHTYSFDSYNGLSAALSADDYFSASDKDSSGELFAKTITSFHNKTIELYIPFINEEVCQLRNKEGFSNISLMTAELYNLPWIWYHCTVNEDAVEIKLAYPSVIDSSELNSAKTYREIISIIAPDAPNPDNYTDFETYQTIYETELTLANDRKVDAMISELKDSEKIYVMFDYDGLLVTVYANNQILSDPFWSSFSLVKSE